MIEVLAILISRLNRRNERGATATEYALLVGFIAFAIILGVSAFGTALSTRFVQMGATVSGLN